MGKKAAAMDMTQGAITRQLISYSVPLILGNLFQLTYNAVDSIIAGRFIGKEAFGGRGNGQSSDESCNIRHFRNLYGGRCADE